MYYEQRMQNNAKTGWLKMQDVKMQDMQSVPCKILFLVTSFKWFVNYFIAVCELHDTVYVCILYEVFVPLRCYNKWWSWI